MTAVNFVRCKAVTLPVNESENSDPEKNTLC